MKKLGTLARAALKELKTGSKEPGPAYRRFVDEFNHCAAAWSRIDVENWHRVAEAFGENFSNDESIRWFLYGVGHDASLYSVARRNKLDEVRLRATALRLCEAVKSVTARRKTAVAK